MKWILDWLLGPAAPDISPREAYEKQADDPQATLIVDVREPLEHRSGTIPGAELMPMTELGRRMETLPRDRQIMTICRSSHRSPVAARRLRKAGFDVLNIAGGMLAWEEADLPIEK